jgi:hypothetical protein
MAASQEWRQLHHEFLRAYMYSMACVCEVVQALLLLLLKRRQGRCCELGAHV